MESKTLKAKAYYSSEIKKLKGNSKKYHQLLGEFLSKFKVYPCCDQGQHNRELCFFYHDRSDRRRNPYLNHEFLYDHFQMCGCEGYQCRNMHNHFQSAYHPLAYKTTQCQQQGACELGLYCNLTHMEDAVHFQYGEFFRFDLRTFKTEKCHKKNQHERKTCLYYHNEKDKRRPPTSVEYSHFFCSREKCNVQECQFSHNKLQQLYHPNRYKTKFCKFYPNNIDKCDYKSFCSFAHTQHEITENIELIHLLEKNTDFYINKYKTVWCPFTQNHERDKCPYAHNIQDFRRNPSYYDYEPVRCEFWNFSDDIKSIEGAGCKFGMDCKKCHGWMEQRYHPSKYNGKLSKSLKKEDIEVAESFVNKKLSDLNLPNEFNKNSKVKCIANLKNNYSKGTPFFKNDKYSEYSAKTKAKSNNFESDKSVDGSENKETLKQNTVTIVTSTIMTENQRFDFLGDEEFADSENKTLWKQFEKDWKESEELRHASKNKEPSSGRSKSAQKSQEYEATYSNSIKDALGDEDILKRLRKEKFNEIQIVNMDKQKIDNLSFLTPEQKQRLALKLRVYNIKQTNTISYSKPLTLYFISKKKEDILQKMRQKRVKEVKLLKLVPKEINQLSFLDQQEKCLLPKLLTDYKNDREFKELQQSIKEATKMK